MWVVWREGLKKARQIEEPLYFVDTALVNRIQKDPLGTHHFYVSHFIYKTIVLVNRDRLQAANKV